MNLSQCQQDGNRQRNQLLVHLQAISVIQLYDGMTTFYIDSQQQFSYIHADGTYLSPSGQWILTGCEEYRFGQVAKLYTVDDILANRVPWFYQNHKQRCYVSDVDHGTPRVQMSPGLVSVWVKGIGYVAHKYFTTPNLR